MTFVAFALDGKAVVTASQDGTLRLWDRATGKELRRFPVPEGKNPPVMPPRAVGGWVGMKRGPGVVSLSRDGKVLALAAASPGQGIVLWDVATGEQLRQFKVLAGGVGGLAFTPDGKTLVVARAPGPFTCWTPPRARNCVRSRHQWSSASAVARS